MDNLARICLFPASRLSNGYSKPRLDSDSVDDFDDEDEEEEEEEEEEEGGG